MTKMHEKRFYRPSSFSFCGIFLSVTTSCVIIITSSFVAF